MFVIINIAQHYVSQIFLVSKKDGSHRPVINLKALNKFAVEEHFKMEGFHMTKDLVKPEDWLAKIDLKDAYFLVPIHPSHQQALMFYHLKTRCDVNTVHL